MQILTTDLSCALYGSGARVAEWTAIILLCKKRLILNNHIPFNLVLTNRKSAYLARMMHRGYVALVPNMQS